MIFEIRRKVFEICRFFFESALYLIKKIMLTNSRILQITPFVAVYSVRCKKNRQIIVTNLLDFKTNIVGTLHHTYCKIVYQINQTTLPKLTLRIIFYR